MTEVQAELRSTHEHLEFLVEASTLLASSLEYETTLRNVARLAVRTLADLCTIDMVDDQGQIHVVAVACADPAIETLLLEIRRRWPATPSATQPQYQAARSGRVLMLPQISDDQLAAFHPDPEHLAMVMEMNPRSGFCIPMMARGRTLGVITFGRRGGSPPYGQTEFALADELALRAAAAVDNALLYREAQSLNVQLEARVAARTAELESAMKELETFAYSVSHDLRAPLRAMDGFSRILLNEHSAGLDAEGLRYLRQVRDSAGRMGQLIDDLLRFSRLSRQSLTRRPTPLAEIVQQAWEPLQLEREDRQVRLEVHDLPEIAVDAALLRQVYVNLLANALKFTRTREVALIEVGSEQQGEQTVYFVKDNGVGFNMRYAHKLFGIFQRLHRAEDYEGTGIGLALAQRIIQRHLGQIWAEGTPNEGARFSFTLGAANDDG